MYVGYKPTTDVHSSAHTAPLSIHSPSAWRCSGVLLGHACPVLCCAGWTNRVRETRVWKTSDRVHGKPCGPRASIKSRCSHCSNSLHLVIRSPGKGPSSSAICGVDGAAPNKHCMSGSQTEKNNMRIPCCGRVSGAPRLKTFPQR